MIKNKTRFLNAPVLTGGEQNFLISHVYIANYLQRLFDVSKSLIQDMKLARLSMLVTSSHTTENTVKMNF